MISIFIFDYEVIKLCPYVTAVGSDVDFEAEI